MKNIHKPGKIILLNGPSSVGKTTIALLLQQKLPEPFWHFSFDHLRDSDILPMNRIRDGEFDWSTMRPSVFDGFHRSLPVLAEAGNNIIVDHIIENEKWMSDLLRLLSGLDVFLVGLHCALPELERRERKRGNRATGEARSDYSIVHGFAEYDMELDTTHLNEDTADLIIDAWKSHSRPTAFERMNTRRKPDSVRS